ncbi:PepSY-associated TM helix domain-containing protein [Thalassotalea aquiviva]|uniref:PepSY-associated TM helix domain-containing protein n=1 Tax=Thalassotalea aquiviva TaxID=3242415 RepID=UPI00352A5C2D
MNRKLFASIHLYLATFLTPIFLLISFSGGLYLFGYKGETEKVPVYQGIVSFKPTSSDLERHVRTFLADRGLTNEFEYLKISGNTIYTRPMSKDYFVFNFNGEHLEVVQEKPDWIKTIVELHKGHGPSWFKTLQKFTAIALVFIVFSGLMMALLSPRMRPTAIKFGLAGVVATLIAAIS